MENQIESNTINLRESFDNLLTNWWKITLFAIIFGLLGLGFSYIQKPKYEAEAIFSAAIDYQDFNFENLVDENNEPLQITQYDLDLALGAVERSLIKVKYVVLTYARSLDPTLRLDQFEENALIERLHDKWYLKYRHEDPYIARDIVNHWVELGLVQFETDQVNGSMELYVIVDLLTAAVLPETAEYQNRNVLILAGLVLGFMVGVLVVDFGSRVYSKQETS
jgi:hypothetical protein